MKRSRGTVNGHGPAAHDALPDAHGAAAGGRGGHGGHDKHAGHSAEMFRRKLWLSLAFTVPTVFWADVVQEWLGYAAPRFAGSRLIPAVFGTAVFFYGGWVFVRGAARELRDRLPGMMTLITLAIAVSFVFSVAVELGFGGMAL